MQDTLRQIGERYAAQWLLWAKEVDAWPDDDVKKDPGAHLDLIYGAIGTGRTACMSKSSFEISMLQGRLKKKCRQWEFLAAEAGHRHPLMM